jgi:hypothetical protein
MMKGLVMKKLLLLSVCLVFAGVAIAVAGKLARKFIIFDTESRGL